MLEYTRGVYYFCLIKQFARSRPRPPDLRKYHENARETDVSCRVSHSELVIESDNDPIKNILYLDIFITPFTVLLCCNINCLSGKVVKNSTW